jgi:ubiquinone/menaquinone biosynthesis C-methylase UbiE
MNEPKELQRNYYETTAGKYDASHTEREHVVALHVVSAFIELNGIKSVLDVGAGTGRAMRFLKQRFPNLVVKGIEPVEALRRRGHAQGIAEDDLVGGDGALLPFSDGSFDLVCEFAVLHHVRDPSTVIDEMNRVASRMIVISDCNFMGQGRAWLRALKLAIWSVGLWPLADWLKTRGKRYTYSEGDGIAYSYSVYQSLRRIRAVWADVQIYPTSPDGGRYGGPISSAGHVVLLAQKRKRPGTLNVPESGRGLNSATPE